MSNNEEINVSIKALGITPSVSSQYRTKVLRNNIVDGVNILEQNMINSPNTKYVIKVNYVLTDIITIPENCILDFDGGQFIGGTLVGNDTKIINLYDYNILNGTVKQGTFKHITAILEI